MTESAEVTDFKLNSVRQDKVENSELLALKIVAGQSSSAL